MKPDIHPDYRPVVFEDTSSGEKFLTRSTVETKDTVKWTDGNTYPLARVEISSASHPFFTGQMTIVDTAGRVERFEKRYGKRKRQPSRSTEERPPEVRNTKSQNAENQTPESKPPSAESVLSEGSPQQDIPPEDSAPEEEAEKAASED